MEEIFLFRVPSLTAARLGCLGHIVSRDADVVILRIRRSDIQFTQMKELIDEAKIRRTSDSDLPVYWSWIVIRKYTKNEIEGAAAFRMIVTSYKDFYIRDYGATYGSFKGLYGLDRLPDLPPVIKLGVRPKVWRFNSGEIFCNEACATVLSETDGVKLIPLGSQDREPYLIDIPGIRVSMSPRTQVGLDPFSCADADPQADIVGLNIISEIYFSMEQRTFGWTATKQRVGIDLNDLRAQKSIIVSPSVREALISANVAGVKFDIARNVNENLNR